MSTKQELIEHCEDVIANPQDHLYWVVDMAVLAKERLNENTLFKPDYKLAFDDWIEKTEWVQTDSRFDVLIPWGMHRADILKKYIELLESKLALREGCIVINEELSDGVAEAIAIEANCCGGIALDIWQAAIKVAKDEANKTIS